MKRWSPAEVAARLVLDHPDDSEMRVSPETIYTSLYVQGKGGLKRELRDELHGGEACGFCCAANWENLTMGQREVIWALEAANRRSFRAFQLKEELRDIFALPLLAARRALDDWLAYASRSKLAPFVKLARTIRAYRASIEATIEWRLTNGIAESNNVSIGRLRTNARGFHDPEAFITMVMLDRAGEAPRV